MSHIVNLEILDQINNVNNLEEVSLPEVEKLDPTGQSSTIFEKIVHAAVDPYNTSVVKTSELLKDMSNDLNQAGVIAPDKLLAAQMATNKAVVDTTVTAKAANMITKGVNELVHIQ